MTLGPACWYLLVGDVEIQGRAEHVARITLNRGEAQGNLDDHAGRVAG